MVIFVRKKLLSQYWKFFFLFGTTRHSLSLLKFERQNCLFGLIMTGLLVDGTWECLIIDFGFSVESCHYVSISDAVFLVTNFSIFDLCLADVTVLMCSFLFIYSILLGYWSLH